MRTVDELGALVDARQVHARRLRAQSLAEPVGVLEHVELAVAHVLDFYVVYMPVLAIARAVDRQAQLQQPAHVVHLHLQSTNKHMDTRTYVEYCTIVLILGAGRLANF